MRFEIGEAAGLFYLSFVLESTMEILAAIVDCRVKKLSIGGASVGLRRGGNERSRAGYWRGEGRYA